MKAGIHPDYKQTVIKCACGAVIETGSTKENINVEICSSVTRSTQASKNLLIRAVVLKSSTSVSTVRASNCKNKIFICSTYGLDFDSPTFSRHMGVFNYRR